MGTSGAQLFLVNGLIKNYFKEKSEQEVVVLLDLQEKKETEEGKINV